MIKHEFELAGVYVVLEEEALDEKYRTPEWRVVKVLGGFGATPGLMGRAIYVQFHDGDEMVVALPDIDRYATAREIHRYAHLAQDTTCLLGDACPSLEEET